MATKTAKGPGALNERQQRFVNAYLVSLNATQAYKDAGYKWKTETVATVESSRLLAKPSVRAAITKRTAKALAKADSDYDRTVAEWVNLGLEKQPTDDFLWTHKLKALSELSARLWPVPKAEVERPPAITVRVLYEDSATGGRAGVQVQVE